MSVQHPSSIDRARELTARAAIAEVTLEQSILGGRSGEFQEDDCVGLGLSGVLPGPGRGREAERETTCEPLHMGAESDT
jgi:hypothetical protein